MAGRTVTRADLCEAVYQRVGLSRTESAELVESVLGEICDCLERGETVKLSSFGSFVVRDKGERIGRNPKTGVEVPIEPRRRDWCFKPSKRGSRRRINGEGRRAPTPRTERRPEPHQEGRDGQGTPGPSGRSGEVAEDLDLPQARAALLGRTKFTQIQAAQARRRPALLQARGRRSPARDPASALRRGLHDQGRAAHPQERGRALRRGGGAGRGQGRAVARARRRRQTTPTAPPTSRRRPPSRGRSATACSPTRPPARLRGALDELVECERLLAALREPSGSA